MTPDETIAAQAERIAELEREIEGWRGSLEKDRQLCLARNKVRDAKSDLRLAVEALKEYADECCDNLEPCMYRWPELTDGSMWCIPCRAGKALAAIAKEPHVPS